METERPGIRVLPPEANVRVEWRRLLFGIGEVVVHGFMSGITAGGSVPDMVNAAFEASGALSVEEPEESKAYALIALSYAFAIDKLRPNVGATLPRSFVEEIGFSMREAIETETHVLSSDFFDNPTAFSLYQATRPMLTKAIRLVRLSRDGEVELAAKLDAAFASAVYEVVSLRREYFRHLIDRLSAPAIGSAIREFEWSEYRSKIVSRFEVDPVFGQESTKVSLSQLYVPCRASWTSSDGKGNDKIHFGDLHDLTMAWIDGDNNDDQLRLISGGPGSGKSSFAKFIAANLARSSKYKPMYVELQKITQLADLQKAVYQRLVKEEKSFTADPLEYRDGGRRIVLIFDGLDELVIPGGAAANRTAESFATALSSLLRVLNGPGICVARAIVTGRTAIAQAFKSVLLSEAPEASLEIQGFVGQHSRDEYDFRPLWWRQYAEAFGLPSDLPQAYQSPQLMAITNEPLLCYLLALSGYALEGWEQVADNHNLIFDKLLGEVWERRWGKQSTANSGRVGPALSLDKRADFDALMETVALATWWGGENRVATKDNFDRALLAAGSRAAWEKFRKDNGEEIGNLALTFYFRRSDSESQGIEFTHKSFSEYLVARFLIRIVAHRIASPLASGDLELAEAAERWLKVSTDVLVTEDIMPFLINEARLLALELLDQVKEQLERLTARVARIGLPAHKHFSSEESLRLARRDVTGQSNMLMCIQAISSAIVSHGGSGAISIPWKSSAIATDFVRRCAELYVRDRAIRMNFSRMSMDRVFLNSAFLIHTKFVESSLRGANLVNANLSNADFANADLTAAGFSYAQLHRANLSGAKLRGAHLGEATIQYTILDRNWVTQVDPRTFERPPVGLPGLLLDDGVILQPGAEGYPDLPSEYKAALKKYEKEKYPHPTFYDRRQLDEQEDAE